jgi:hypothetical protein
MSSFNVDGGTSDSRLNKGCAEGVVPAQGLIPFNLATEVRTKEEETPEKDGSGNSERDTKDGTDGELGETETRRALKDDVKDVDEDGDSKVEGDSSKPSLE